MQSVAAIGCTIEELLLVHGAEYTAGQTERLRRGAELELRRHFGDPPTRLLTRPLIGV